MGKPAYVKKARKLLNTPFISMERPSNSGTQEAAQSKDLTRAGGGKHNTWWSKGREARKVAFKR